MARIKIGLPAQFLFTTSIPVRITDINYGDHVGNDAILSIIHEARMQFLGHYGYTEMKFGAVGLIMRDVAIEFKAELFYGDTVIASVTIGEKTRTGFEILYKLEKEKDGKKLIAAVARTGMVFYDYERKRVVMEPVESTTANFISAMFAK